MTRQTDPASLDAVNNADIAVVWSNADARCLLSWTGVHYRIWLLHGPLVLSTETSADERTLLAVARLWRVDWDAAQGTERPRRSPSTVR